MIKIAILMGGASREREISFAGGRTVYDNLNKNLFEPLPVFVDHQNRLVELDWQFVYKGTIRDFFPPAETMQGGFQAYSDSLELDEQGWQQLLGKVGKPISIEQLKQKADLVFLTLHGLTGEDGQIQGLLDWHKIPYTGSGLRASAIGMDKAFQKKLMRAAGFETSNFCSLSRSRFFSWPEQERAGFLTQLATEQIGAYPLVVRPANQGSSIGVQIVAQASELLAAVEKAFFTQHIHRAHWQGLQAIAKRGWLQELADIRTQIGFPLTVLETNRSFSQPAQLSEYLDAYFAQPDSLEKLCLAAHNSEQSVVLEGFIHGKEFSCVVVEGLQDGELIALPPTEIVKGKEVFDYRAKYLAGLSRKITPIDLPNHSIAQIREEACRLFAHLGFEVYARIDGFYTTDGKVILNDPNTTSGMLPSSFFFHQSAEIGLNPSEFLTFIIYKSLQARARASVQLGVYEPLLQRLEGALSALQQSQQRKQPVAVLLGGYSSERHISVESGRNVYEKLSSSTQYQPFPVFVSKSDQEQGHQLHLIPTRFLLKDNADDIREKIADCERPDYQTHPVLAQIRQEAAAISAKFAISNPSYYPQRLSYPQLAEKTNLAFIALHGRPGEDGQMQTLLIQHGIAFNGSMPESAALTIDKFRTLQTLKAAGLPVAEQFLLQKTAYETEPELTLSGVERLFDYPFIAKPVDDGCSSAVKMLKNSQELRAYLQLIFRNSPELAPEAAATLRLKHKEEFPAKAAVLLESLISKQQSSHFLEVTGGLLTHHSPEGIRYELFEPSETLASGEILSLEEKFLAGEGQNITPARFVPNPNPNGWTHQQISEQVRADLERAARLLGVSGYARIDAFVRVYADGRAETLVIEVNSLPGMTPATCIFHQCALNGYKPLDFIDKILQYGLGRLS